MTFSHAKRGAVLRQSGKTRITIPLDRDVVDAFRARAKDTGRGYQTGINQALRVPGRVRRATAYRGGTKCPGSVYSAVAGWARLGGR